MLNTLSSLLKVEKKKKSNQKNNQTTNTKTRQTKKGWFLRFRRTQSQNHPSGVTSSAFICTFSAKGKHGVASCWSCFTCPGNHFPQWELYPVKEIGLVNTKAVCNALTASPERKNEVLLSSQRLLYAKNALRISKNDESCHHDVGSSQRLCIQIYYFIESPEKGSGCRRLKH